LGLNIDGGREVRVRLRRHNHESEFYPYEDVLGTLLHELTHNVHGPHDAKFYKLLDEITKVLHTALWHLLILQFEGQMEALIAMYPFCGLQINGIGI
jgi:hypothetical protein